MKKYEVILKSGEIGIYFGRKKPKEGDRVKIHIGNGVFVHGFVYDVMDWFKPFLKPGIPDYGFNLKTVLRA